MQLLSPKMPRSQEEASGCQACIQLTAEDLRRRNVDGKLEREESLEQ